MVMGRTIIGCCETKWTSLQGANLTGAILGSVSLVNDWGVSASLQGANLTNATYLADTDGSPLYNAGTNFTGARNGISRNSLFDPVAAGWTLVPEPTNHLALATALLSLAALRRRVH